MPEDHQLLFSITKNDFKIERTKGSGKGGQNRNKRETAIRITHKETGISSYCADQRNQHQNLTKAFKNLINKPEFQKYLRLRSARAAVDIRKLDKKIVAEVDEWTQDKYLRVEYI